MLVQLATQLLHFLRRANHHQDSVDTCTAGIPGEFGMTITLDRIQISHQDYRCGFILPPEFTDDFQHPLQADTIFNSPLAGRLDHRAVSGRI